MPSQPSTYRFSPLAFLPPTGRSALSPAAAYLLLRMRCTLHDRWLPGALEVRAGALYGADTDQGQVHLSCIPACTCPLPTGISSSPLLRPLLRPPSARPLHCCIFLCISRCVSPVAVPHWILEMGAWQRKPGTGPTALLCMHAARLHCPIPSPPCCFLPTLSVHHLPRN